MATMCLRVYMAQQEGSYGYRVEIYKLFLRRAIVGFAKQKAKSRITSRSLYNKKERSCLTYIFFT